MRIIILDLLLFAYLLQFVQKSFCTWRIFSSAFQRKILCNTLGYIYVVSGILLFLNNFRGAFYFFYITFLVFW